MKPQRVVAVTGGSGQLGTLLLQRLVAIPEIDRVISIDLRAPHVASDKLVAVIADIRDEGLSRHFAGADAVIHCAFMVSGYERSPRYRSVNVDGSKNVFRSAVAAGVETIVYVSSITAYGCVPDHPVPIVESTARVHQPDFPYASCKFELEAFLDEVEPQYPQVAISRIRANVLIGRKMLHMIGRVMRIGWIPDPGGTPLPIVWDEDVADLMLLALRQRARGAFNAAADELLISPVLAERTGCRSVQVSRIGLFAYIGLDALLTRLNLHRLEDPSWATQTRGAMLVASSARAKSELGWSPRYPTAVAVVQHFREIGPRVSDLRLLLLLQLLGAMSRGAFDAASPASARIFLCLNGPVGGDFSLFVERGWMSVRAGAPAGPTSTFTLTASLFRDLLAGRAEAERAWSEGQIALQGAAADVAFFNRLLALLATHRRAGGLRSLAARAMARCL